MVSEFKKRAVMSRRQDVIRTEDYEGDDRREDKAITREEFDGFVNCSRAYREENTKKISSIHTALFAPNADNEHGQPGLMHTARRIEQHIDAVCTTAKWIRGSLIAVATTVTACAGAGHALGWW